MENKSSDDNKPEPPKDLEPTVATEQTLVGSATVQDDDPSDVPEEDDGMDLREKALYLIGQIQGFGVVLMAHKYDSSDSRIGANLCNIGDELKGVVLAMPFETEVEHIVKVEKTDATEESS